jgi:hypothetical protein
MSVKWRFILIYGLGYGACAFLLTTAWKVWIDHQSVTSAHAVTGIVVWSIAGLAFGAGFWARRSNESPSRSE